MIMKNFKRRGSDSTHEKGTFVMGGFFKTSLSIVVAMCKTATYLIEETFVKFKWVLAT